MCAANCPASITVTMTHDGGPHALTHFASSTFQPGLDLDTLTSLMALNVGGVSCIPTGGSGVFDYCLWYEPTPDTGYGRGVLFYLDGTWKYRVLLSRYVTGSPFSDAYAEFDTGSADFDCGTFDVTKIIAGCPGDPDETVTITTLT